MSDADRRRVWILAFVCLVIGIRFILADVVGVDAAQETFEVASGGEVIVTLAGIVSLAMVVILLYWLYRDGQRRRRQRSRSGAGRADQ